MLCFILNYLNCDIKMTAIHNIEKSIEATALHNHHVKSVLAIKSQTFFCIHRCTVHNQWQFISLSYYWRMNRNATLGGGQYIWCSFSLELFQLCDRFNLTRCPTIKGHRMFFSKRKKIQSIIISVDLILIVIRIETYHHTNQTGCLTMCKTYISDNKFEETRQCV